MRLETAVKVFIILMVAACHAIVYGGTTGKLAGVVSDAQTGEPLIGVNIIILGTQMGASTDFDGSYAILNIPPDVYSVAISMVGYQQMQVANVEINIDFTTTLDVKLNATAIEIGTQIITAERPIVTKDMTSSLATTTAEQIEKLPVQSVQQVLQLNAGVIEDNGRLSIRGGRTSEVAYWVNGISTTDVFNGTSGITVENTAVQELQVISGTFNAEYGQAMSGIVNIVTKEGGQNYKGQIRLYGGDYVSSRNEYGLYKNLKTAADTTARKNEGYATKIESGEWDKPLTNINPIYNAEFSLSGPFPVVGDDVTFFATGRYVYDEGYYYGREWFKPSGVRGDSDLVPMNPFERYSAQGKLSYRMSSSVRVSYDLFWNKSYRERSYFVTQATNTGGVNLNTHDYKYVPNGLPHSFNDAFTHLVTVNHLLSPATFYELRVSRFDSEIKQYVFEDPLQVVNWIPNPDTTSTEKWLPDPNGPEGYIKGNPEGNFPTPTQWSFLNKGMDLGNTKRNTQYWTGKLDFTSQINKSNQVKAGLEGRVHRIEYHGFRIIPKTVDGVEVVPFAPDIPDVANINRNDYVREPREFSAYIQDKVEFDKIIFNIGLRWDYFDPNSVVLADPTDPNIYTPFRYGHIYAGIPDAFGYIKDEIGGYDHIIDSLTAIGQVREYTPTERRAFMHKKTGTKMSLSPRLGIAFPITDRGVIHFSYGHFFQIPDFQYLYANPDFKISQSSGNVLMGNAELEPQKTVMYEIGLQQQLTDDLGVDVALFYRDVRDWVGTSALKSVASGGIKYSQYENQDYENVKGITFKVEKRLSNNYSFRADYTFQSAEGSYSSPNDRYNAVQNNRAPVLMLTPMGWDQKHTLNGQIIYQISDWTFSAIGKYWSGQPYTPSFPQGDIVTEVSGLAINSARLPAQKSVDLTINKTFRLFADIDVELFLLVYNLFDQRDETAVYADTGTAEYTTNQSPSEATYNASRVTTVEDFILQPTWYTAPRQIQVGVILGF